MGEKVSDQKEYFLALEGCIETAIACRAFLKTHRKKSSELKAKIDKTKYANVHNLLLNAVQQDLLLCVAKVWDRTNGSLSLFNLIAEDEWANLQDCIAKNTEKRIKAKKCLEALVKSYTGSDRYRALLVSRAEGFAHNVPIARERMRMDDPQPATLNDIYFGLNIAIRALNLAALALNNTSYSMGLLNGQFTKHSELYLDLIPDLNGG